MHRPKNLIRFTALLVFFLPALASANVSGPCGSCHTMHNSQSGESMAYSQSLTVAGEAGQTPDASPNPGLLITSCIGCHAGINSGVPGDTPYVLSYGEPTYGATGTEGNTLAGGNFFWVSNGLAATGHISAATGHNVTSLAGTDSARFVGNIPGSTVSYTHSLTCAGTTGCHGDRSVAGEAQSIAGGHHGNDMSQWKNGVTVATSYRFLYGVEGFEDPGFEYQPTSASHNRYYGKDRSDETDDAGMGESSDATISSLCAQCHGDFHNGSLIGNEINTGYFETGRVWLRHPTDFDMNRTLISPEYDGYKTGSYNVISPVASAAKVASVNSTVSGTGNAIVMCLSCHRAHGTPYDAILRWDYKKWPGNGATTNGCLECHSAKQ